MEPLWSPVVATGGNRSQIRRPRNPPKQAETIAVRCDRLPATFHGKEGVDGSSPSEGSAKAPHVGAFSFRPTCSLSNVQRVWSRLWSFRVRECPAGAGSYAGYSVMLTGDSNKPCWERVVGYYEGSEDETGVEVLTAQNLHASHHGSRTFVKDAKDDPEPHLEAFELIDHLGWPRLETRPPARGHARYLQRSGRRRERAADVRRGSLREQILLFTGHVHPSCRSDVRVIQPGVACGLCRNTYGAGTVGRRPRRRHIHRGLLERSSRSGDTLSGRQAAPRVLRPAHGHAGGPVQ